MVVDQNQPEITARHYYLENFQVLSDFVFQHYEGLLSPQETHFYHTLAALPEPAKLLCIRLLMRRGEYLRESRISYPEIGSLADALAHLTNTGLIETAHARNAADWLNLFTKDELHNITPMLNAAYAGGSTPDTLPEALTHHVDLLGDTPLDLITRLDTVYKISCKEHYQVFLLLFFGNLHQDLTEFVLRDLGIRGYENYLTDTTALPFQSRAQLLAYQQYYACESCFDEAVEQGPDALRSLFKALPDNTHNDPVLQRRVHQLYNHIARQLEREAELTDAAIIYQLSVYPPARERLARVEASRGNYRAALDICHQITAGPNNSEELEFAGQFSVKLCKKLDVDFSPASRYRPPELAIDLPASQLSVEYASALHFARTGHCYYVENSLLTAVLGLTFWDVIFAPVKGVFFNPFQRAPLDFNDADFITRRRALIDNRLLEITQGKLREILFKHFYQKSRLVNPLVQWQSINYTLLSLAVEKIPADHWLVIFDYMLRDIKNHRSGLPDLIYFPNCGGYQLLEVKGPGDSLQKHQRRWMKHFSEHQIPHALVNANYQRVEHTAELPALLAG